MNVGDYVRTEKGVIGKIKLIDNQTELEDLYLVKRKWYYKKDIIKSSPNIIDLIEVGDYVNGRKVSKINLDRTFNKEKCILCADTNYDCLDIVYKNEDIKSIVTKECFKSMEYKVKE